MIGSIPGTLTSTFIFINPSPLGFNDICSVCSASIVSMVSLSLKISLPDSRFVTSTSHSTSYTSVSILLFLEPEGIILYKSYKLDSDHISEMKGVLVKRTTAIPYRAIADQRLKKGIIGRILNYGDVIITGPKIQIKMRGIRRPEMLYEEIEKKLANLMPSTNPSLL